MKKVFLLMIFLCLALTTQADPYWKVVEGLVYSIDGDSKTATVCAASDYTKDATYNVGTSGELVYQDAIVIPASIPNPDDAEQPFKVTAINDDAFSNNTAITSITINAEITTIPDNCFQGCTGLTSFLFGEEVTSIETIGSNAFESCTQLGSIAIPNGVTTINAYAFYGCSGMTEVSIPASITTIGSNAFQDCTQLGSIAIPYGVTTINAYTFYNCSGMAEVSIPVSVETINKDAFLGCSSLQKVIFASIQQLCSIDFENKNANPFSGADPKKIDAHHLYIYINETSVEEVKDINLTGVTEIKQYAFSECWGLTGIYIPASVTTIGTDAFDFEEGKKANKPFPKTIFESLESLCKTDFATMKSNPIYYQNDVYIGKQATNQTTVDIPSESLKDGNFIRANILANATKIVTVSIPEGTTRIGVNAFYNCGGLQAVNYPSLNAVKDIKYENEYSNPLSYATYLKVGNVDQSELELDHNVNENAFINAKWLKKITFKGGVEKIGKNAFKNCTNLTAAEFETTTLTTIEEGAFYACTNLKSIELPDNLKSLGKEAFRGCWRLINVSIPETCDDLGIGVFRYCSGLTTAVVNSKVNTIPKWFFEGCNKLNNLTLPAGVSIIETEAFKTCKALTVFPALDNLTTIRSNAFNGCSGLTDLVLPNQVVFIGEYAFAGCSGITSLTIPASTTDILNKAFDGCTSLTQVFSLNSKAVKAKDDSFGDMVSSITLYVSSEEAKNSYKAAAPWCNFKEIIPIVTGTLSFYVNDVLQEEMAISKLAGSAIEPDDLKKIENVLNQLLGPNDEFSGWDEDIPMTMPNESKVFHGYISYYREIEGFKYHLLPAEGSTLLPRAVLMSITDEKAENTGIVIPKEVTYNEETYPVKVIASKAFRGRDKIEIVTLPDNLNMIESAVFYGCSSISQVMNFPNNLTAISDSLFFGCSSLVQIHVKETAESTNSLPVTITQIGREAFKGCSRFNLKTFPAALTTIGYQAFYGNGMTSISFPKNLTRLDKEILKECKKLKTVVFEDGFSVAVSNYAFMGCTNLERVTLSKANSINQGAFMGCTSLKDITIPATVGLIGDEAFAGCKNLRQITEEKDTPPFASESAFDADTYDNAILYVPVNSNDAYLTAETWTNFKKQIVSEEFDLIYLLDGKESYKEVGGVQTRTRKVKAGATITINNGNDDLDDEEKNGREFSGWVFSDRQDKTMVMPADNVTVKGGLEYKATYYIDNDEKTTTKAFYGDNIEIPVDDLNVPERKFTITFYMIKKKENDEFEYEEYGEVTQDEVAIKEIKMPANDIKAIVIYEQSEAETEFNDIKYRIVDMNIPDKRHAELIDGSKAKGDVTIPSSVEYNHVNYTVTAIGDKVFRANKNLKSITIPESIVEMGMENFAFCSNLTNCFLKAKINVLPYLTFKGCEKLESIKLPEGITTIGDQAFSKCFKLSTVELPSTLESIGFLAFSECELLKNITLPPNLVSIGEYAFVNALGEEGTLTIHKDATKLPEAQENTFDDMTISETTLKTNLLLDTTPWSNFLNSDVSDDGGTGLAQQCEMPGIAYENQKLVFTCATQGATIVYNIAVDDQKKGEVTSENSTTLVRKYVVTAYAKKKNMMRSETARFELPWFSKGDVNDDGIVTVTDAVEVIKICTGNTGEITPVPTPNE